MVAKWKTPPETPEQDWDIDYQDVSVRVIVDWEWASHDKPQELRFARYHWGKGSNYWVIEGITGTTTVKRWIHLKK